ncbi:hypothetical protein PDR5_50480 [Pseudomonas sp. DR 5-09]|nr:hypothetical protein PDR5_50480 [Pseudomonas sp. DR 5-09]
MTLNSVRKTINRFFGDWHRLSGDSLSFIKLVSKDRSLRSFDFYRLAFAVNCSRQ